MKSNYFYILLLVAFSFAFVAPVKDLKLEYKYKVGDQYDLSQTQKQNVKQEIPGMGEVLIDILLDGSMNFKVVEVTTTGGRLEVSYTSLKMQIKSPNGEMVMDSHGADDNMPNKIIKALLNKPFFVNMTKQGGIEKVENIENLYSGFSTLGIDEATAAQMTQSIKQSLGESAIKNMLEMALPNYPEKGTPIGGTWNTTTSGGSSFPIKTDIVWTLSKVEANVAHLESDGTTTTPDKEKITPINGMNAKSDLSGRQMIKAKVDVKTGWPSEINTLSEIKGDLILLAGGPIPEDMKVPMVITSEITFKLIKK